MGDFIANQLAGKRVFPTNWRIIEQIDFELKIVGLRLMNICSKK
jgi:hypothetical protein